MIAVRSNFDALACFHAHLRTSPTGHCTAEVKLPDSLTKYRVFALATTGASTCLGVGESAIEAVLPLTVRPSLPRFLNVGDCAEFTVVVQNQTEAEAEVAVVAQVRQLTLVGGSVDGFKVLLAPKQRTDVRFRVQTEMAGTAQVRIGAQVISGPHVGFADAASGEIPVWTPATAEAFATHGEVDDSDRPHLHAVALPVGVHRQYGGLQVSTSSTILQSLTDAFVYLVACPFECTEQLASKAMALALLRDVQAAFHCPQLPVAEALPGEIDALVTRLLTNQRGGGGFGFWSSQSDLSPYATLHAAHCFACLLQKGFRVEPARVQWVADILLDFDAHLPQDLPPTARRGLKCKACYVLTLLSKLPELVFREEGVGPRVQGRAQELWAEAEGMKGLDMESAAWLVYAIHEGPGKEPHPSLPAFLTSLLNQVEETAERAHIVTKCVDGGAGRLLLLMSDARVDATVLEVLQVLSPQEPLIPKLAKGLLGGRRKGRWSNTQENIFALIALDRYFRTAEAALPSFQAHTWLDQALVSEHTFEGRETKTLVTEVPMAYLMDREVTAASLPLLVQKTGSGRLYYRLGLTYAPLDHHCKALDAGFIVQRSYAAVNNAADVQATAAGYTLKAGALVRVTLTMEARAVRYHVALVDKLPACLEPLNAELVGTTSQAQADRPADGCRWAWRQWYEHQNLRDERAEAFTSQLAAGAHTYSYVAAVTSTGSFVAPPATVEEMYSPEVFGRSASLNITVQ